MRDLLDIGAELAAQPVDRIMHLLARFEEAAVGHHDRARGIIDEVHVEQLGDALVGRAGLAHHLVDDRRELEQGELVGEREGAIFRAQLARQQELRRSLSNSWLRLPSSACGTTLAVTPHASFKRRRIGSAIDKGSLSAPPSVSAAVLQRRIMVAMRLDIFAHPGFRRDQRPRVAFGGERRVAANVLQRRVEPGDRIGDRRGVVGEFGELVARHAEVGEQRVGEDFGQLVRPGAMAAARREGAHVDLVGLGQLEQQRRGHRPLVALEMIEIGRADRERRGHVGLRQAMVAAEAAKAVPEEKLRAGHLSDAVNSRRHTQVNL